MKVELTAIEEEIASRSRLQTAEAVYYWICHQPRYRHLIKVLDDCRSKAPLNRILDVGMGFQTLILSRMFPESRVDCMGTYEDDRYRPESEFAFHRVDLNEAVFNPSGCEDVPGDYDLILFMEVIEHLYAPPDLVLKYLASKLRPGGLIIVSTPNAVWLKNRLKMFWGKNPFETLRADRTNMGHVREYTQAELERALASSGLTKVSIERRGLYYFNNTKDRIYSRIADLTHPSLRRSIFAVYRK